MKLQKLLYGLAAACLAASCVAPFPVSAAYTGNTVTLTQAQTLALFGNSIEVTYYQSAANGQYEEVTVNAGFARNDAIKTGDENNLYYSANAQNFAGRQVVTYSFQTSDLTLRPTLSSIKFKTAVDISGLAYIDTGLVEWVNSAGSGNIPPAIFTDTLYGAYNDYWHTSSETFFPIRAAQPGTNGANYYGCVRSNWGSMWGALIPVYINRDNLAGFSFGVANCNIAAANTYQWKEISIVCPIISDNWQYTGNHGAGDYDPNSSSGGGSDGGSTDLSGVHSRLDDIIALLDEIADNTAGDGSSSSANSADQSVVASDNSRVQQEINSAVSEQSFIDQVMNADSIVLPEMENSYEVDPTFKQFFEFTDSGGTVHQTPLFAMMILGITIAALSYILFGKGF